MAKRLQTTNAARAQAGHHMFASDHPSGVCGEGSIARGSECVALPWKIANDVSKPFTQLSELLETRNTECYVTASKMEPGA